MQAGHLQAMNLFYPLADFQILVVCLFEYRFYSLMYKYYPDMKAEDFAIQWQARLLYPHSSPDWLLPLPGEPGKIFLNPSGGFDGDPPRE